MNPTPQQRKSKWYERAKPSKMMVNSSISPIRNESGLNQNIESNLNISQNMNGSDILSNSIHSVSQFNNDFIIPQIMNISQINQVSQNNSQNNSLIQSQSTLFKSQKANNQLDAKIRGQKTPDMRELKSTKRGLKSISDIDDKLCSTKEISNFEIRRNRLLDLVVTKNFELVRMAVLKQAFRSIKKIQNRHQMFTIALNKLHRIIRYHPLEILSYALKQIKMYEPSSFGRFSGIQKFTQNKGLHNFKNLSISTYQDEEKQSRSLNHCKQDLKNYLNIYDTPQQKIPHTQFKKAFACMRLAEIQQLIEDKQFKLKAIFFIRLVAQYSSHHRVPLTDCNGYSIRKTQSKSPIAQSRNGTQKRNTQITINNNLLSINTPQQKWKPSTQILGRINQNILGSSMVKEKRPSNIDQYKVQKNNDQTVSSSQIGSYENDKTPSPKLSSSYLQKSTNTKSLRSSNINNSYLNTKEFSPNQSFNLQRQSLSPVRSRLEKISQRKRGKKQFGKDYSCLLVFLEIYNKRMREYFNQIRAHYIRRSTYSPTKYSRMSGVHHITPIDRSFSPFTHSHLLDMSQDQKNQSMLSSPAFRNMNNFDSVNNNQNKLNPATFLQDAGIRQTVSYIENNNNKNQLFESIDLKKDFQQEPIIYRPYQQEQDSIVELQRMTITQPIITNLNEIKPQLFQRFREEEEEERQQIQQKKVEKSVLTIVEQNRNKVSEELRDRRVQKGMDKLAAMLLKKKEMKMINYIDVYVKYEMVSYMLTRVLTTVRTRNLIGAFMKISSYGYNKYNKKEKIGRMFYHLECLGFQRKRTAVFQIQKAALNNKAKQTTLKSLMFLFQNKEFSYKKLAFTNMKSLVGVSRTFVKGKFSQYHFLAMKFQDIFRKCAQRKKREALNTLFKWSIQIDNFSQKEKQNDEKRQFMLKKLFTLLFKNKLKEAFSQIQISSKQKQLLNVRRSTAFRSLNSLFRNKQRMQLESAFLSIQQEQHISLSKEKIKLERQTNALKHEQSKSLRNKAIAYRIAGILQKLVEKRKSDAFRKVVLTTFKNSELQQQRLQKLSKVFFSIFNRRLLQLSSDAFSCIKWSSNNKFIKRKMATQQLNNILNKKLKDNLKSAFVNLKSHRFIDAYQSRQRKTLSKSFYLMLSVKLKNIFENRRKQNNAFGFAKIKNVKKEQVNLTKLVDNIRKFKLRNALNELKQQDNNKKILSKAMSNLQKIQNSIEKDSLYLSWNRLLRCKLVKKQNTSKALVVLMTLQNILKQQKRNVLVAIKQNNNILQNKQRAARRLGQKLSQLEKTQIVGAFQQLKQYGETKVKLIKRLVSILRVPYNSQMKQAFETIREFDLDTYQEVKQSNQFVVQKIQNIIESDNKYISPLSKRQMMIESQQYEQDYNNIQQSGTKFNGNSSTYAQRMPQLMASPSTDRTIKLNSTTPFRLSTIKIQQPQFISQEEISQRQRQRYSYIANILNRKSKLALKRQLQNAFEKIYLTYQQQNSLQKLIVNIGQRQQRDYLQSAFNELKEFNRRKQLSCQFVSKLAQIFKNSVLLPHYLHFMNTLKENNMSKIYVETYQNLEISQAKKRSLKATLKQGEMNSMSEVLQKVNDLNNQQKQLYTRIAYTLESSALKTKRLAFSELKLKYQEIKLAPFTANLEKLCSQYQQYNKSNSFNQIKNVGNILYKSKQLTIFCQKLSLIVSKKILQQKYEGLFSIIEQSNNMLQTHNFSEIKKNTLSKIIMKQRQKHLISSFFLWKRINKEYSMKKTLEQESVNNDLYFEVISFLNQRKNFENVIDNELKKIQNSAMKTNLESDKKPFKIQSSAKGKELNQFGSNTLKQNSAIRESLDKNRSYKNTTTSSFNVTSFYPESTDTHQQEKRYDSGDYMLDSYQYQLQSQKKQLYNQFMNQSKTFSPQQAQLENIAINNIQFIPTGVPIIEEDDDSNISQSQSTGQQLQSNKIPVQQSNQNKVIDEFYAQGVADFSFTEQENEKY